MFDENIMKKNLNLKIIYEPEERRCNLICVKTFTASCYQSVLSFYETITEIERLLLRRYLHKKQMLQRSYSPFLITRITPKLSEGFVVFFVFPPCACSAWLGEENTRRECWGLSALSEKINECCQLREENVKYCKVDNIIL